MNTVIKQGTYAQIARKLHFLKMGNCRKYNQQVMGISHELEIPTDL